jgi:hypothetical protein
VRHAFCRRPDRLDDSAESQKRLYSIPWRPPRRVRDRVNQPAELDPSPTKTDSRSSNCSIVDLRDPPILGLIFQWFRGRPRTAILES